MATDLVLCCKFLLFCGFSATIFIFSFLLFLLQRLFLGENISYTLRGRQIITTFIIWLEQLSLMANLVSSISSPTSVLLCTLYYFEINLKHKDLSMNISLIDNYMSLVNKVSLEKYIATISLLYLKYPSNQCFLLSWYI